MQQAPPLGAAISLAVRNKPPAPGQPSGIRPTCSAAPSGGALQSRSGAVALQVTPHETPQQQCRADNAAPHYLSRALPLVYRSAPRSPGVNRAAGHLPTSLGLHSWCGTPVRPSTPASKPQSLPIALHDVCCTWPQPTPEIGMGGHHCPPFCHLLPAHLLLAPGSGTAAAPTQLLSSAPDSNSHHMGRSTEAAGMIINGARPAWPPPPLTT